MSAVTNNINNSTQTQNTVPAPAESQTTQTTRTVFQETVAAFVQIPDNEAQYAAIQARISTIIEAEDQQQNRCCKSCCTIS